MFRMFRPHYQVHAYGDIGTLLKQEDVVLPLKIFLARHELSEDIVQNVNFQGNSIYIRLKEGSAQEYGDKMDSIFKALKTSSFSYSLNRKNNLIYCWVPFIEDVVEANNLHEYQCHGPH